MPRLKKKPKKHSLAQRYPPSEPCACSLCLAYCTRPGWWTVNEAGRALDAGLGARMMLEVAPDRSFGVLSPAFSGCEGGFALQQFAARGCNFLKDGACELHDACELHGGGLMPLECRFCHHDRPGLGPKCHADIETDWNSATGRALVARWCSDRGLLKLLPAYGLQQLIHNEVV
jgi:hypothetical protein